MRTATDRFNRHWTSNCVDNRRIWHQHFETRCLRRRHFNFYEQHIAGKIFASFLLFLTSTWNEVRCKKTISLIVIEVMWKFWNISDLLTAIQCQRQWTAINYLLTADAGPKNEKDIREMKNIPYQKAVQLTRPDICFALAMLRRSNENPGKPYWIAVFAYSGTWKTKLIENWFIGKRARTRRRPKIDDWLFIRFGWRSNFVVFEWAANRFSVDSRIRSNGRSVSYSRNIVSKTTWERTTRDAIKEITIFCDSKSTIHPATNNPISRKTKHIDIQMTFMQEKM